MSSDSMLVSSDSPPAVDATGDAMGHVAQPADQSLNIRVLEIAPALFERASKGSGDTSVIYGYVQQHKLYQPAHKNMRDYARNVLAISDEPTLKQYPRAGRNLWKYYPAQSHQRLLQLVAVRPESGADGVTHVTPTGEVTPVTPDQPIPDMRILEMLERCLKPCPAEVQQEALAHVLAGDWTGTDLRRTRAEHEAPPPSDDGEPGEGEEDEEADDNGSADDDGATASDASNATAEDGVDAAVATALDELLATYPRLLAAVLSGKTLGRRWDAVRDLHRRVDIAESARGGAGGDGDALIARLSGNQPSHKETPDA